MYATHLLPSLCRALGTAVCVFFALNTPASSPLSASQGSEAFPLASPTRWSLPFSSPIVVVDPFRPPPRPWESGNRGIDLDLPLGSPIYAPAPGRVLYAGVLAGRPVLSLDCNGVHATFEPLDSSVHVGQYVERGDLLGTVAAGHSPGTLHWGAKISRDQYADPLRLVVGSPHLKRWDEP